MVVVVLGGGDSYVLMRSWCATVSSGGVAPRWHNAHAPTWFAVLETYATIRDHALLGKGDGVAWDKGWTVAVPELRPRRASSTTGPDAGGVPLTPGTAARKLALSLKEDEEELGKDGEEDDEEPAPNEPDEDDDEEVPDDYVNSYFDNGEGYEEDNADDNEGD